MPYATRQRQAVLRVLERQAHPVAAPELAEALRQDGEPVGLATVYRQLERLAETGLAHKISSEAGAVYQYCPRGEKGGCFLLRCAFCGRLEHLECPQLEDLYQHLAQEHKFQVDPRRTILTGRCGACAKEGEHEA